MNYPWNLLSKNFLSIHPLVEQEHYLIEEVDASSLLTPQRFDLAAKLMYIRAKMTNKDIELATKVYSKHIEAFSEGSYCEPGDDNKQSLDAYLKVFDELIDSFAQDGFDADKSLIPVGKNNVILDGAHRTACAIFFHCRVTIIRFPSYESVFDYSYFLKRKLSQECMFEMSKVFLSFTSEPSYLCCIYPAADVRKRGYVNEYLRARHSIIWKDELKLSYKQLRALMIQLYCSQSWIGNSDDGYCGVYGKLDECYRLGRTTSFILFFGGVLDDIILEKDELRSVFGIGKHSLHITDSLAETIEVFNNLPVFAKANNSIKDTITSLRWWTKNAVLKCKQLAATILNKIGVYSWLKKKK